MGGKYSEMKLKIASQYNQIVKEELGVKNTLIDLNNHLFAQLERLSDEELKFTFYSSSIKGSICC